AEDGIRDTSVTGVQTCALPIFAEGRDRVLTLPWTRPSSRRRREIIQRLGEAQQPLRAMRTKARDGFIKALRDAHRWLDELLVDPTQTVGSLAIREGKSERSIRMTLSLAFMSPALAEAAMDGRLPSASARVLGQAPDRPAGGVVRAMARPGTAGANSAAGRTQLIDATAIHCNPSSALNLANAKPQV